MTGVNIITYYSPRIFATLGIQSTDLRLFATGFYGVAKTLGMVIFSFWVADHLGRRKGLIWGAFVGAVPMVRTRLDSLPHPPPPCTLRLLSRIPCPPPQNRASTEPPLP